jgi:hypothetical protein
MELEKVLLEAQVTAAEIEDYRKRTITNQLSAMERSVDIMIMKSLKAHGISVDHARIKKDWDSAKSRGVSAAAFVRAEIKTIEGYKKEKMK